jgi:hypothetical protein
MPLTFSPGGMGPINHGAVAHNGFLFILEMSRTHPLSIDKANIWITAWNQTSSILPAIGCYLEDTSSLTTIASFHCRTIIRHRRPREAIGDPPSHRISAAHRHPVVVDARHGDIAHRRMRAA